MYEIGIYKRKLSLKKCYICVFMQFFRAFISYSIFLSCDIYILYMYNNYTYGAFRKTRLISFILSPKRTGSISFRGVTQIRFSAADEYSCVFRKFNGDGAVPFLWRPGDVVARTPAPLSRFIPSLFIALSLETSSSLSPLLSSLQPSRCISSLFPTLWQDTAATDNIYYKTWPSMPVFHARVSLCSGQSEKRNSLPDDESRWLIGERINDIISYLCSILHLSGFFYLSILLSTL